VLCGREGARYTLPVFTAVSKARELTRVSKMTPVLTGRVEYTGDQHGP